MSVEKPFDEENWIKGCVKKKRFSEEFADDFVKKMRKKGLKLWKYKCPFCSVWHTTTKKQRSE